MNIEIMSSFVKYPLQHRAPYDGSASVYFVRVHKLIGPYGLRYKMSEFLSVSPNIYKPCRKQRRCHLILRARFRAGNEKHGSKCVYGFMQ